MSQTYATEEEAIRAAQLANQKAGLNIDVFTGQPLTGGQQLSGQQVVGGEQLLGAQPLVGTEGHVHHHHHLGENHQHGMNPLTNQLAGTNISGGNQYSQGVAYGTPIVGNPVVGNTGKTGHHVGAGALGAGALGAGALGAGALAHNHGAKVGTGAGTGVGTGVGTGLATGLGNANGTVVFRPLEGKFYKDKDPIGKMDAYCKFKIGWHSGKSSVAKSEGTHPTWGDVITLDRKHHEEFAKLKIKDKDRLTLNDKVGEAKISLSEIAAKGRVQQWFNVYKKEQLTGEVLIDIEFQPRTVF